MNSFIFNIIKKNNNTFLRRGEITTPHGTIQTPSFVTVGTKGTVKSLKPLDIDDIKTQFIFVNTYHLVLSPGLEVLKEVGGIHNYSKINAPLISDSGGFQVFSLARTNSMQTDEQPPHIVKITDDGVKFKSPIDGQEFFFTPEFSINAQKIIGADFIVAFDECAPAGSKYEYTKKAMNRTHEWAKRSLAEFNINESDSATRFLPNRARQKSSIGRESPQLVPTDSLVVQQEMYGVIQGGQFEDLRKNSAEFISSLPFFGIAIGGVAVGESKDEMRKQVKWVMDVIKGDSRPRHLLGVGEIDDIFDAVELGMDTMDCVTATRHARMGVLYKFEAHDTKRKHEIDITKLIYKKDFSPIDENCICYACQNFSKSYLHHLFKQRELLAYHLATIHNIVFMENLFAQIRESIENEMFKELKDKWTK